MSKPTEIIPRKEAIRLGMSHYFTGVPCKNGHVDIRSTSCGSCRSCNKKKQRKHYWKDPESGREQQRKWYKRNKDKSRIGSQKWRRNNPDKVREMQRRNYYNHKEKRIAYINQWKKDNYENVKAWNRNRKAIKKSAEGRHTRDDIADLMRLQKGRCAYCEKKLKQDYHVDHIVPISKGGSNNKRNLAISCVECNLKKGSKTPEEWAAESGRLL